LYSVLKKEGRMPSDDRERSFENALARHLRAGDAADDPRSTCSDAETLAAYHERSLAPEQMASVKTHVSHCERCQQILAHLEATDEIPVPAADLARQATAAAKSSVPFPARRPSFWRWVAPAGALAAALLVWVAVHENNSVRTPVQPTRVDERQAEIAKDLPASPPQLTPPSPDATRTREADSFSALLTAPPSPTAGATKQRRQSLLKEKDSLSAQKKSSVAGDFNQLVDNSPNGRPPTAWDEDLKSQRPGALAQTVTVEAARTEAAKTDAARTEAEGKAENGKRVAPSPPSPQPAPGIAGAAPVAPPAPPPARAEVVTESAAVSDLPAQQRAMGNLSGGVNQAAVRLAKGTGEVNISAPDGQVSWRAGQAGVIEFSADAGKTWTLQPSGVIADLLAGSAPSDKICWIVGRSGTVLRTTDGGKHWRKLRPPALDDLRSIFAVDARQATVSPTNGAYQTTDGGATWTKLPPE
jgi:hypothetical protein